MNVLITGAAGFIGGFLAKHCLDAGCSVLGIDIRETDRTWHSAAAFERCDVRDSVRVSELLAEFKPERIFHLAAQSYPTVSLLEPRETIDSNVNGTVNLYECLRALNTKPVVVVACSSAEYGLVASQDLPVKETHALNPLHPYGVSKVGQDLLAQQYFANYKIPSIRIRIFNTTGPGKVGDVCSDLSRRVAEIELGMRPPSLLVGNTTPRRALVDARDLCRGLWMSAECCVAGDVYNLGGDQLYSVQEVIDMLRTYTKVPFQVEQDPALVRVCDEPVIAGDISKFRKCSGWKAEVRLDQTLRDMLEFWRHRLAEDSTSQPAAESHLQPVRM
jgi:GDP-4-dehydro-6-deoxy-D-mannose reductase